MARKIHTQIPGGFTLAELLTALLILGVIATFTIPKVLSSNADSRKKSVFRETIAAMSDIYYTGMAAGEIQSLPAIDPFDDRLNYVEICPGGPPHNCWATSEIDAGRYYRLASGAHIFVTNSGRWEVDWNGADGPNTLGDDRVGLQSCPWPSPVVCDNSYLGPATPYGKLIPRTAASNTLHDWIFSN